MRRLISGGLFALYSIALVWISLAPVQTPENVPGYTDKAVHFVLYAVLVLIGCLFFLSAHLNKKAAVFSAAVYSVAMGLATECLQKFVAYRTFDWLDWVADCCGVLFAGLILMFFPRSKNISV